MRKIFVLCVTCILFVLSCTISEKAVFDESVPIEDSAWVTQGGVGKIVGYNGISVDWNLGMTGMARIPAGDTVLEWNIDGTVTNTARPVKGEGILFRYNFHPQKKYFFRIMRKNNAYGLDVHSYNFDEEVSLLSNEEFEMHFVDFVPFLNVESGTTVLN